MAIPRRLVLQTNDDKQNLRVDQNSRFVVVLSDDWQFVTGPDSSLTSSGQVLKIAAQFDVDTMSGVKFAAYLYNPTTGGIDAAGSVQFSVSLVEAPDWTETFLTSFAGTLLANNIFFAEKTVSELAPADIYGDDTLMIEAVAIRSGTTFRDRIYVNHLGIYDNVDRLRQQVDFLDITKLDE